MRTRFVGLTLFAVALLAGCDTRTYEVELTPKDGKLERQLTGYVKHGGQGEPDTPLGDEELNHLAQQYGQRPPAPGGGPRHTFRGLFESRLPQDIGGHGTYVEWPSEFGVARLYVERFRGDDDLARSLELRRKAIDRMADLLVGWVDETWADQPEHAALRRFVDTGLRRDLINVSYYLKVVELSPGADDVHGDDPLQELHRHEFEPLLRAGEYLAERQYWSLGEVPKWTRVLAEMSSDEPRPELYELLQKIVRTKIGIPADEPLPPSLALLGDPVRLVTSLNDYLRDTAEYRASHAEWQQLPLENRPELPPEPLAVLGELMQSGFALSTMFGRPDHLRLTLHTDRKPTLSNGTWHPDERKLTWNKSITNGDDDAGVAPTLAYAAWTVPDEAQQMRHFGKVVVDGERLVQFCLWRASLTEAELGQWTRFVQSLTPDTDLGERLETFRFEGEPEEPDSTHRSTALREILQGASP